MKKLAFPFAQSKFYLSLPRQAGRNRLARESAFFALFHVGKFVVIFTFCSHSLIFNKYFAEIIIFSESTTLQQIQEILDIKYINIRPRSPLEDIVMFVICNYKLCTRGYCTICKLIIVLIVMN